MLLLFENSTGTTHVILVAFNLNDTPGHVILDDEPPEDPVYDPL